jgi:ribose-phosphate pyrophosphokinase
MSLAVFGFVESLGPARRLARELGIDLRAVEIHRFPDGESLVRAPEAADTAIVYRSLDRPNDKLVELLLTASALRDGGAGKLILVAPYLAYMRQDIAFRPGEAVSQKVVGRLLADTFDGLVTLDPHLHRIAHIREAIPEIPAIALSAAPVLADALAGRPQSVLVGPDSEARPWVEAIAARTGHAVMIGEKRRLGDRRVTLAIPGIDRAAGRSVVLVDDVVSSGTTLIAAAELLRSAGAASVEALATHCLAAPDDLARIKAAGITRIRASESVPGPSAELPIAALLAQVIRAEGWA